MRLCHIYIGKCTLIPQLPPEDAAVLSNPKTHATSLPTYLLAGMLWAFVPLPSGPASYYPLLPDDAMPDTNKPVSNSVIRDFYYSYDFLLENFFDIAHIPYAHHTLQSTRDDGVPLNATLLTDLSNTTHIQVKYGDKMRGKLREGIITFSPPSIYTLHTRPTLSPTAPFKLMLMMYVMPVEAGRSRAIVNTYMKFPGILGVLIKPWLSHIFSNRFVDSDLWVHDQEVAARRLPPTSPTTTTSQLDPSSPLEPTTEPTSTTTETAATGTTTTPIRKLQPIPKYTLLAKQADVGVTTWRNWWVRHHMSESRIFGPAYNTPYVSKLQQSDRYDNHVKYCKICQNALKKAELCNKWSILLVLLPLVFTSSRWIRALGLISFGLVKVGVYVYTMYDSTYV